MADEFTLVEGRVEAITPGGAIIFARALEAAKSVPLSLIHHDDRGTAKTGETARLRIRTWKAKELGWTGDRDAKAKDFFGDGDIDF